MAWVAFKNCVAVLLAAGASAHCLAGTAACAGTLAGYGIVSEPGVVLSTDQTTLYGASAGSGPGNGSVFKIDVASGAISTVATIKAGRSSSARGLTLGPDGMLYGVAYTDNKKNNSYVFRMDPSTGKQKLLFGVTFKSEMTMGGIDSQLAFDTSGTVFAERGTLVLRYDPSSGKVKTLHSFGNCYNLGYGLVYANATGLLYGTATNCSGQGNGAGLVFSIDPKTGAETDLVYSGTEGVGGIPSGLVLDKTGQLFVETEDGPDAKSGGVFKIDTVTGVVTPIYSFSGQAEGHFPSDYMAFGPDGMLYGAMRLGGQRASGEKTNDGTLWKLDVVNGVDTILYNFSHALGFYNPYGTMAVDDAGDVFGSAGRDIFRSVP